MTLGYMTVIYSFSTFAISLGYSQTQGGNLIAILNVGTALGRPLIGVTSDHLGRITTATAITGLNSLLAFAFWIPVTTYAPLVVLALFYGATCGVFWAVRSHLIMAETSADLSREQTIAPVCAEVVPLNQLASLLCLQWLTVSMPSLCMSTRTIDRVQSPELLTRGTVAQAIALEIRRPDSDRAFLYPQIYTGVSYAVGTAFLLALRRRKVGLFGRERHR